MCGTCGTRYCSSLMTVVSCSSALTNSSHSCVGMKREEDGASAADADEEEEEAGAFAPAGCSEGAAASRAWSCLAAVEAVVVLLPCVSWACVLMSCVGASVGGTVPLRSPLLPEEELPTFELLRDVSRAAASKEQR